MPEGLEKNIPPQAMSDLVHYILSIRYDRARTSTLPGWTEPDSQPPMSETVSSANVPSGREEALAQIDRSLKTLLTAADWSERRDQLRGEFFRAARLSLDLPRNPLNPKECRQRTYQGYTVANVQLDCGLLRHGEDGLDPSHDFPRTGQPLVEAAYRAHSALEHLRCVHLAEEAHDFGPTKRQCVYQFFADHFELTYLEEQVATIPIETAEQLQAVSAEQPLPALAGQGHEAVQRLFEAWTGR